MLENKLFEALLDVIPFGAYAVDIDTYEVVYANKLMRENMYAPQENYCWEKVFGQNEICNWCSVFKLKDRKLNGIKDKFTCEFFDETDDKWLKSYDELMSWPDGRDVKYSILVDITDQKEIQGSMMKTHAALAIKNKQANLSNKNLQITKLKLQKSLSLLEVEKQKAQQSTQSKSNFLANMSHEIRTPMNGIVGMTHLLKHTHLTQQQNDYVEKIENASNNLLNIINDILDFSKIEAGKLEIENISYDMKNVIANLRNLVELKAYEKDLKFDINYDEEKTIYYGDPLRVGQVLINLVINAIKFTEKGEITVDIKECDNNLCFSIKDTGIGMNHTQIDKLFSSFSQADTSTTRKYGGTGLGLSISKQLIELMGGDIDVKSEVNIGSEFTFNIPLKQGEKNDVEDKDKGIKELQIDLKSLQGSKILLVEDNIINQEIIEGLLEHSQIEVDIASNGKEAFDMFENKQYELILMDIQMPIMDGYEATKKIRKINKEVPIIALTANAMKEDVKKTKLVGMNGHLNKPIDIKIFFTILLKFISKKVDIIPTIKNNNISSSFSHFRAIDAKKGLELVNQNEKLYKKILSSFYDSYKNIEIKSIKDDEELKLFIHTLKGLSGNIGASALYSICVKISNNFNKSFLALLELEFNKIISELNSFYNKENNIIDEENSISQDNIKKLFLELKKAVESKRIKNCKVVIEKIENYKLCDVNHKFFIAIKECLDNYDFKKALAILNNN